MQLELTEAVTSGGGATGGIVIAPVKAWEAPVLKPAVEMALQVDVAAVPASEITRCVVSCKC